MDEQLVERVARELSIARGMDPDALYQHHEWEDWPVDRRDEYKDAFTGEDRVNLLHYAWRHFEKAARAIIPIVQDWQRERDAGIADTYRRSLGIAYVTMTDPLVAAIREQVDAG